MKIPYKKKQLILPLSAIFSFSVLSAENCTPDQIFHEKVNNFTPNTEIVTIESVAGVNIDELTQKIPNYEVETDGLKFSVIDLLNIEINALQLAEGIENGNTQEIVNSSVMLASNFTPIIVDATSELLALELDSNPITMSISGFIMEGLNIYNGTEADKTIAQKKRTLSNADKRYKDTASNLRQTLSIYRNSILGDNNALIKVDEENVSKLVLGALRKQVHDTVISLSRDALNQRTLLVQKTSLLKNKPELHVSDNIFATLDNFSYFLNEEYSVQKYFVPPQEKIRFIPGLHASYTLNRANLATIWSGSELSRSERGLLARGGIFQVLVSPFKHYFKDNVFWAKNVYLPILNNTLDKMYVNNDLLHKVLKDSIQYQLTNPDFQENLRVHYNSAINRRYAWIKFGSELLENLDLTGEKSTEALLWTSRVLLPFIEPFFESRGLKKINKELSVASQVASIVNELIKSNIDIHNKAAFYALIKADSSNDDLPSSVMNALDTAYNKTLQDADSLNLGQNEIKPFNVSAETVKKIMNKLDDDINKGVFKKAVELEVNNYAIDLVSYKNFDWIAMAKFYAMAEKISLLQAAYNGNVVLAINNAKDEIKDTTDEKEIVNTLQELGRYLIDNYLAFYDSDTPIKRTDKNQDVSFISFGALPFARNDLKYMLDVIDGEINARLNIINPKPKSTSEPCNPNDKTCF